MEQETDIFKPSSILPREWCSEHQRFSDDALREMLKRPKGLFDLLNPDICPEPALDELASLVGIGAPYSPIYNKELLCLKCRRSIVKDAWIILQHGTEAALRALAKNTESSFEYTLLRDDNRRVNGISLNVYVTDDHNNNEYLNYYFNAYTSILPYYPLNRVQLGIAFNPMLQYRYATGVGISDFTYFLQDEDTFP